MAIAGRNEPCPCGSGRKYKRCCGYDRVAERALEERLAAIEELARLAFLSPRLLPESDTYDAWVRATLAGESEPDLEAAIAALGFDEPQRILLACLDLYPDVWSSLSARCGSDRDAVGALLGGAVAAGIRDFRYPERFAVETVEAADDLSGDPFEALAMCLEGSQLWGREEGREAERAIDLIPDWVDDDEHERRWHEALRNTAPRLSTAWHSDRLRRLVGRVEQQLPFDGFPRASAAIETGCRHFAAEEDFRLQLAAVLLGDMIGQDILRALRSQFAAA
jgi:hypothetical protein